MIFAGNTALMMCRRALADLGTRSTITSVFPPDGSTEAVLCSIYYDEIMLQLLRAANWNFATRTNLLTLWKALPGTPENPTSATQSGWSPSYPAPPWTYSYVYPVDCVRARKLIGQPQQVPIAPPIFSGSAGTNPPISQRLPMARFEVSTDVYDSTGASIYGLSPVPPIIANGGSGYAGGDAIVLAGGTLTTGAAYAPFTGRPAILQVSGVATGGVVNLVQVLDGGLYSVTASTLTQASTTGSGSGFVMTVPPPFPGSNPYWATVGQPVISTQQEFPLLEYTYWDGALEQVIDPSFSAAFVAAMAGRLCSSLTGDKTLANQKYALANELIINARTTDANEALTVDEHLPDWLLVRGAGGGLGYEQFFYPLGPLFPVAPLI